MPIIRLILNNGFFILFLVFATSVYLAYSSDPDFMNFEASSTQKTEVNPTQTDESANSVSTAKSEQPLSTADDKAEAQAQTETKTVQAETPPVIEKKPIEAPVAEKAVADEATEIANKTTTTPEILSQEPANSEPSTVTPPTSSKAQTNEPLFNALTDKEVLKQFSTPDEAVAAARNAFYKKDYAQAERIYFALAFTTRDADVLGELGNVLYVSDKKEWAAQAWIESAKALAKQNRLNDAFTLANRLSTVSPSASKAIQSNVAQLMKATPAQSNEMKAAQVEQRNQQMAEMEAKRRAFEKQQAEFEKRMRVYQAQQKAYYDKMRQAQMSQQTNQNTSMPPASAEQRARAEAYRKQMTDYQARLKAYQESLIQTPNYRNNPYPQPMSQAQQKNRLEAYQKQMAEYYANLRAHHEKMRYQNRVQTQQR